MFSKETRWYLSNYSNKEQVLDKVRSGKVYSEQVESAGSSAKRVLTGQQDRCQLIRDAETRLDELLVEKLQVCVY